MNEGTNTLLQTAALANRNKQQEFDNALTLRNEQRQNALLERQEAKDFRAEGRENRASQLAEKQTVKSDQANEMKLMQVQADTIGRALDSVQDDQSFQAFKGFMGQISKTPLGQGEFFQSIAAEVPPTYDPKIVEQGRQQLSALRSQLAQQEQYTLSTGQARFEGGKKLAEVAPEKKPSKQIERTVDLGDTVEYVYADGTREVRPKGASPATVATGDRRRVTEEMAMRKEFTSLPEVKTFTEMDSQIGRIEKAMEESMKTGSKVAVDQALINIFNRMQEPDSVVRESEYARTAQDLAIASRIRGKLSKWKEGGTLPQDERDAIARMARNFYDVSKEKYNQQVDSYRDMAERYGYAPENILRLGGTKGGQKYTQRPGEAGKYQQNFEDAVPKQAPDGNWYVKGKDGSFYRVENQ